MCCADGVATNERPRIGLRRVRFGMAELARDPERPSGWLLSVGGLAQSYVDVEDPTYLRFSYLRHTAVALHCVTGPGVPLTAVHIGGGACTLPRYLAATRPGTDSEVYEIDGALVRLDERELGLTLSPSLRATVGDARMLIGKRATASADLVVGDAFGHLVVPWHLATREMAAEIKRVTRPSGIYVQNVIDYPPLRFIRAEVATVAAEFPHVALVAPESSLAGETGSNFLIVASRSPLPLERIRASLASDDGGRPVALLDGAALADFVGDARVLTDEFAPVDQLLATS